MADDKSKRGSADRLRINVHEDYERRYWAKKFHITQEELRAAVKRSGPIARNVERDLRK